MNVKTIVTVALICGLASLGGCASMKGKDSSAQIFPNDTTDWAYVQKVDRAADAGMVRVVWLNPPDKTKASQTQN